MSPAGYHPKTSTKKYKAFKKKYATLGFWVDLAESRATRLNETLARLEWTEQKLAWAYGIMVVGSGLLGGLLLAVLTR